MPELTQEQLDDPYLIKVTEIVNAADCRDTRKPWGLADVRSIREMPPVKETEERYKEIFASWKVEKHNFIPNFLRVFAVFKNGTKKYVMFLSPVDLKRVMITAEDCLNNKE